MKNETDTNAGGLTGSVERSVEYPITGAGSIAQYNDVDVEATSSGTWVSSIFPGSSSGTPSVNLGFFLNTTTGVFLAHSIVTTGGTTGNLDYLTDAYWRGNSTHVDGVTVRVKVEVPASVLQTLKSFVIPSVTS